MRNYITEEDLSNILTAEIPWRDLYGATVLISGAYGFVVAYLVETLLYLNEKNNSRINILALVRNPLKAERRFSHYLGRSDLRFIYQDVCDPISIDGPVDYIIHGASWASPSYYGGQPVGSLLPNVIGTQNLLNLSVIKNVKKFLFFSSAEIYGKVPLEYIPTKETFPGSVDILDVRSCYAESKRMGEAMCIAWNTEFGIPVNMARIFHTYGPGMSLDDGRVFADFVSDVVNRRNIRLMSSGTHSRAFCYLTDSTRAFFKILLEGQPAEAYNMGNDDAEVSIIDLANVIAGLFPELGLCVDYVGEKHVPGYIPTKIDRACPDTSKLRSLGWAPSVGIADGFRRTVLSYL